MQEIRLLTADEVECRVATVKKDNSGCSLLLYKDARVDMRILDETFGPMNWQRHHGRDNANCIISVWDDDKKQWIEKEDTGTESNTEAAKGLASDSFKRAGFNWGIGRELYDAPFIWVKLSEQDLSTNGKITAKFFVKDIEYDRTKSEFVKLKIVDSKGVVRFELGKKVAPKGENPINITSVSDNGLVRFINGVQCQVKDKNGNWLDVEFMSIKLLEALLNDDKYKNAHSAVRAMINAKSGK